MTIGYPGFNVMKCESLQLNLPLYTDTELPGEERAVLDEHLANCTGCKQRLDEFRSLRNSLRALERPAIPLGVSNSVRQAVTSAAARRNESLISQGARVWLNKWLVPSGVGAFASVLGGMMFIWLLAFGTVGGPSLGLARRTSDDPTMLLANSNPKRNPDNLDLTPSEYAQTRLSIAGESPSVNPNGALIALTRSLVRGEMKDDEVVVVAEVFGNGLARISEVVEPSHDHRAVAELEQALKSDPAYAPFVPADFDKRSDSIRVILKIQSVDVKTHLKPQKK
jgi:hypothetical protein